MRYLGSALVPALFSASPVLDRAQAGVEAHRKGEFLLRVLRPERKPISGVSMAVEQRQHDFLFGATVRPREYTDQRYLSHLRELFNFVELLEFNWGQYEPDEGKPLVEERRRFIFEQCLPYGLEHFYGHMLVWSSQYGEYPKTCLPLWLFRYDRETQYRLLKERIQREVRDYADVDILWDVVNEAIHCRVWGDWEKPPYTDEPIEAVVPYVRDALLWAREANPNARLLINDYGVIPRGKYQERYRELLDRLLDAGAPLDAIGIQAHEPYKGAYWYSPEEVWEACELFGTGFGLPIYFTEFWYVWSPEQEVRGPSRQGRWNPELHAEAVEEFYRITFGHPKVAGIVYFGLVDGYTVPNPMALLDEEYRPRPAWERLQALIHREWRTQAQGFTDHEGAFRFRGFYGRYHVEGTFEGRRYCWQVDLRPGTPTEVSLSLADAQSSD